VFISYSTEDRPAAARVAAALSSLGYTVWWDQQLRVGASFDEEISSALSEASCVVVLWSRSALRSNWVRDEAQVGWQKGALVPALIDAVEPPLGFRGVQTADLTSWLCASALELPEPFLAAVSHHAVRRPSQEQELSDERPVWQLSRLEQVTSGTEAPTARQKNEPRPEFNGNAKNGGNVPHTSGQEPAKASSQPDTTKPVGDHRSFQISATAWSALSGLVVIAVGLYWYSARGTGSSSMRLQPNPPASVETPAQGSPDLDGPLSFQQCAPGTWVVLVELLGADEDKARALTKSYQRKWSNSGVTVGRIGMPADTVSERFAVVAG
jgi:hypothetical protein